MIEIKSIYKYFNSKGERFCALNDVSLSIQSGSIHGIIGHSGAGKSTLIRVINQLEKHDLGEISLLGYEDISKLDDNQIRLLRKDIGMIFQSFNLLQSKNVYENIAFPMKLDKKNNENINTRISKLIDLVGLNGKEKSFPFELSGGQQQRVGIARALVNNPKILLCDEPTSALDPITTMSILNLLKKLNEKLNITIVIVTHDMKVIKEICDNVTVMAEGMVVEKGEVDDVFFNPKHHVTRDLVKSVGMDLIGLSENFKHLPNLLFLKFNVGIIEKTIINDISSKFDLKINIVYANISPHNNGVMLVSIDSFSIEEVIKQFRNEGVEVKYV